MGKKRGADQDGGAAGALGVMGRQAVSSRGALVCVLLGVLAMGLVAAPRFARHDVDGPTDQPVFVTAEGERYQGLVTDHVEYLRLTEFYAGSGPAPDTAPFSERLLAPWLASFLPLAAPEGLAATNLGLLALGLGSMVLLLRSWRLSLRAVAAATAVYAVSFPVLWYSATGWVDAASVGTIGLCVLAAYRRWWLGLVALVPAVLTKESALICVVFGVALELCRAGPSHRSVRVARAAAWVVVGAGALLLAGAISVEASLTFAPWVPRSDDVLRQVVARNMRNPGGLPEVVATAVVPALVLVGMARDRVRSAVPPEVRWPMATGILAALALSALSFVGALWDGRLVWASYPFAIPLGAWMLDDRTGFAASDRPTDRPSRAIGRIPFSRVVLAGVVVVAVLAAWSPLSRIVSPPVDRVDHGPLAFADRLGRLRPDDPVTVTGVGRARVPLPVRADEPLLVDYDHSGRGGLELLARPDGAVLTQRVGDVRGTVPVDPSRTDRILVRSDGRWTLRFRSIDDAFQWTGYARLRGATDAVVVIPGGSDERRVLRFNSTDPGAHVSVVGPHEVRRLESGEELPPGTEAVAVRSDGPWQIAMPASAAS